MHNKRFHNDARLKRLSNALRSAISSSDEVFRVRILRLPHTQHQQGHKSKSFVCLEPNQDVLFTLEAPMPCLPDGVLEQPSSLPESCVSPLPLREKEVGDKGCRVPHGLSCINQHRTRRHLLNPKHTRASCSHNLGLRGGVHYAGCQTPCSTPASCWFHPRNQATLAAWQGP